MVEANRLITVHWKGNIERINERKKPIWTQDLRFRENTNYGSQKWADKSGIENNLAETPSVTLR